MPSGVKGWVFLVVFLAAVWYAWTHFVKSKVK